MADRARPDLVTPELRRAEQEIDNYYRSNPIVRQRFAAAAWRFLAACEEQVVREVVRSDRTGVSLSEQQAGALFDNLVVDTKWPMRWLLRTCQAGGSIPRRLQDAGYVQAMQLHDLGHAYTSFEAAFTYASLGLVTLTLDGHSINVSKEFRSDTRYDAYNRLRAQRAATPRFEHLDDLLDQLARTVGFKGEWFYYDTGPSLIRTAIEALSPMIESRFELPSEWRFTRFSLREFRAVMTVILVLAFLHFQARLLAAASGCIGLGYARALYILTHPELFNILKLHTGLAQGNLPPLLSA